MDDLKEKRQRVIIFGIDGGTLDLIGPWAKEGKLPNFKRVLEDGVHGRLMSTIHPLSAQAWTSFMTGKNSGKHGIFDFTKYNHKLNNIEVVNREHVKARTLWNILSKSGKKVAVANVPMTYPPEKVNGLLISGWLSPSSSSNFTYPTELKKEIFNKIGDFIFEPSVKFYKDTERHNALFIKELRNCLVNKRKVFDFLFDEKEWDFFTFVYVESDRAQYKFWKYLDKTHPAFDAKGAVKYGNVILDTHKDIDKTLGKIIDNMEEGDLLLIVSDHGFGPVYKTVYLNKWLEEEGFLSPLSGGPSQNIFKGIFNVILRRAIRISRWGPFAGLAKMIDSLFPKLKDKALSSALFSNIDWSKTKAFSVGYGGNIYVNLKQRQPSGIVDLKDYDDVRNDIIERLKGLKDPDANEPMVDYVYKREELFEGKFVDDAPDLLVAWKDYKYWVNLDLNINLKKSIGLSTDDQTYKRAGDHKLFGIFCAYGNNIKKGAELKDARLLDILPTVLYYLGIPIPKDTDGRVLKEIFIEDFNSKSRIKYEQEGLSVVNDNLESVVSEKEQELLKDRLKELGYM